MNETLLITQIIEKNGRAYALFMPYGAPYDELYEVIAEFDKNNRDKQAIAIEEAEKRKLEQEIENGKSEVGQ